MEGSRQFCGISKPYLSAYFFRSVLFHILVFSVHLKLSFILITSLNTCRTLSSIRPTSICVPISFRPRLLCCHTLPATPSALRTPSHRRVSHIHTFPAFLLRTCCFACKTTFAGLLERMLLHFFASNRFRCIAYGRTTCLLGDIGCCLSKPPFWSSGTDSWGGLDGYGFGASFD